MKTLRVELGERSYPIYIGPGLLADSDLLTRHIPDRQVMVVTNDTVGPLYLAPVVDRLANFQVETLELPDGEEFKTIESLQLIYDQLLRRRFERRATLLALGGGVVGDIVGFAAATYQRGINFLQIPTTLLAQVDSSVGGKTGVNHPLGKNMIGAFYQPRCVLIDTDTLSTLDDRQLRAGTAEIIKYGLIRDEGFFGWLESHMRDLLARNPEALAYAIERSCQKKAAVVAEDERESGNRALLNLGHTFGHAIETGLGYGRWLHGEAVAAGMAMAADLSRRLGWLSESERGRVENLLAAAGLPTHCPGEIRPQRMLDLMGVDKKVMGGRLRLVLLETIGRAVISSDFPPELLDRTLQSCGPDP
jgi:3-dehydroquinate synthase